MELDFGKQEVNIPLIVAKKAVWPQTLKNRLVASLCQAIASRAVTRSRGGPATGRCGDTHR